MTQWLHLGRRLAHGPGDHRAGGAAQRECWRVSDAQVCRRRLLALPRLATWRDRTPLEIDQQSAPRSVWQVICTRGAHQCAESEADDLLFRVPAAVVHPGEQAATGHLVGLSLIFMAVTSWSSPSLDTSPPYAAFVLRRPQVVAWVRRTFAASYVLLAGRLACTIGGCRWGFPPQ